MRELEERVTQGTEAGLLPHDVTQVPRVPADAAPPLAPAVAAAVPLSVRDLIEATDNSVETSAAKNDVVNDELVCKPEGVGVKVRKARVHSRPHTRHNSPGSSSRIVVMDALRNVAIHVAGRARDRGSKDIDRVRVPPAIVPAADEVGCHIVIIITVGGLQLLLAPVVGAVAGAAPVDRSGPAPHLDSGWSGCGRRDTRAEGMRKRGK